FEKGEGNGWRRQKELVRRLLLCDEDIWSRVAPAFVLEFFNFRTIPAALEQKKLIVLRELLVPHLRPRTPLILKLGLEVKLVPIPVRIVATSSHSKSVNAILKPHI
ncbi:hypothetical protein IFR04_016267, partial [Cadophora malorum]